MEQFAEIRRDHRVDGLSIRALADRHGVHRRTVRQALESAVPPRGRPRSGSRRGGAVQDGPSAATASGPATPAWPRSTRCSVTNTACPYSINVVQAILSHPAVDAFVASRGRLYRGSYVVHRKAFMDPVPVPALDTAAQQEIEVAVSEMQRIVVQLRTEQDAAIRTTLTGRFEVLRTKVNDAISAAYELSKDDMAAIVGD